MKYMRYIFCFISIIMLNRLVSEDSANHSLDWKSTNLVITAKLDDEGGIAWFNFKNTSNDTIHIAEITPSCPCVAISRDKNEYSPGEWGKFAVSIDYGLITKTKDYTIKCIVVPLHRQPEIYPLHLKVETIAPMTLDASQFAWINNTDPSEKSAKITVAHSVEIKSLEVTDDKNNSFETKIDHKIDNNYILSIKPKTTVMKTLINNWNGKDIYCEILMVRLTMKSGRQRAIPFLVVIGDPNIKQ